MFAGEAASDQAEPFEIGESVSVGETWKARGGKAVFVALFCYIREASDTLPRLSCRNGIMGKTTCADQGLYRLSARMLASCRISP
jgi:hypothetical protein